MRASILIGYDPGGGSKPRRLIWIVFPSSGGALLRSSELEGCVAVVAHLLTKVTIDCLCKGCSHLAVVDLVVYIVNEWCLDGVLQGLTQ